jgi:PAS domain S-box-containing protein
VAVSRRASVDDPGEAPGLSDRARLELLEQLLEATTAERCAELTLDWLARAAGADSGVCTVVDDGSHQLILLASYNAAPLPDLPVDLDDRNHPMVIALGSHLPVSFKDLAVATSPIADRDMVAVPLWVVEAEVGDEPSAVSAFGLLLLSGIDPDEPDWDEARFACRLLSQRLAALRYRRQRFEIHRRQRELAWHSGILEAVTDPVLLSDASGRVVFANRSAEALLSTEEGMSEGRRRAVALNNMLFSASLAPSAGSDARRLELPLVDPIDGRDLLFERLSTGLDLGGGEKGSVTVLRDVTDLRRAAQALEENYWKLGAAETRTRAERDRLESILNSVLDPVLVTDSDGRIDMTNPPAERLFSAPEGVQDEDAREAIRRRLRGNDAVFTSCVSKVYSSRSARLRSELELTHPLTGENVPFEAIAVQLMSEQGVDRGVVTVLHDLTEAKERARLYEQVKRHSEELEAKVREATAELAQQNELLRQHAFEMRQASAMKSQFLANVSHELRTPLNAIVGYNALLLEGVAGEITPPQRTKLERLQSNARHLLSIINELLDISRIEAGKLEVRVEEVDLASLVQEVMSEVEPLIPQQTVRVKSRMARRLPRLYTDRQKVKQILLNLLSNALKFTPSGAVTITTAGDPKAGVVTVSVSDTGVGIAEEQKRWIFEPFGQGLATYDSAGVRGTDRATGTGLGLSISHRLASALGGTIELDSALGVGSTFVLRLPIGRPTS